MANQYISRMAYLPEDIAKRRLLVMKLRVNCMAFDDIARQVEKDLGQFVSVAQIAEDFRVIMKQRAAELHEATDDIRTASMARISKAMNVILPQVEAGSIDHIEIFLKLEQRLARLMGTDSPIRKEIDDKRDRPRLSDGEVKDRIEVIFTRLREKGLAPAFPEPPKIVDAEILSPRDIKIGVNSSVQGDPDVIE